MVRVRRSVLSSRVRRDILRYYAPGAPYRGSAGVDIALWDLIGKACGQPYRLWGGGREKVPAYASMVLLSTPEERARLAATLKAEGWQAIKLRIHHATLKEDVLAVEQVRKAVGDAMTIMVDANQAQSSGNWQLGVLWDYRRAVETATELRDLGCCWLEEPLPRCAFSGLAGLNEQVEMPIVGGENNHGIHEFLHMLRDGVYDVLQPESMVNGGVTDLRKIGVLAEAFGKQVAPHHGGRGLGSVAHLHLVASSPHAPYLELLHDPPIGAYYFQIPRAVQSRRMKALRRRRRQPSERMKKELPVLKARRGQQYMRYAAAGASHHRQDHVDHSWDPMRRKRNPRITLYGW